MVTASLPPDARRALIRRVMLIVADAPGGGLHRDELRELLGLRLSREAWLRDVLGALYGRGKIDFARGYIVKPGRAPRGPGASATGQCG